MGTYSKTKALIKGIVVAVVSFLIAEVTAMLQAGTLPLTKEDWGTHGAAIVIGLVTGALKVIQNTVKNREMYGNPLKKKPSYPSLYRLWLVGSLLGALFLSGCATTLPAVGGRTHYNVQFSDTTNEQDTRYSMEIKAPAGAELASITGMNYDWKGGGSGSISVSQDQATDTTGQAALISEVNAQQIEAFREILNTTLNAMAPILGQWLQSRPPGGSEPTEPPSR